MAEKLDRCWACMEPVNGQTLCPHCHFDMSKYRANPRCLQPGASLGNRYIVGKVLGEGGFGITYIGWDTRLDMPVAIKEYFPSGMASRDTTNSISDRINVFEGKTEKSYHDGLQRFMREARNLSKFHDSHGIVSVHDFFHENETAYLIMEYIPGMSLKEYISGDEEREIVGHGRMKPEKVFQIMKPVMRSLEKIHRSGMIHRDISPDNIMITPEGEIKLIDFGAMRTSNDGDNKSLTIVLKRGFAPEEQYRSKGQQGPWTDVYAISATIYYMLTGKVPPEATERYRDDPILSFAEVGVTLTKQQSNVVMKGLAVQRQQRYQTIQEMFRELYGDIPISQTMEEPVEEPVVNVTERRNEKEARGSSVEETVLMADTDMERIPETVLSEEIPKSKVLHVPDSTSYLEKPVKRQERSRRSILPVILGITGLFVVAAMAVVAFLVKGGDSRTTDKQNKEPALILSSPAVEALQDTKATQKPIQTFKMIDVTNQKKSAAANAVKGMGDEQLSIKYTARYSDTIQKGHVIRQSIAKGTVYRQGEKTELTLIISKGEQRVAVPDVVGKSREKAIALIHKRGLKYEITAYPNSSVYDKGDVMKQFPASGKRVKKKTTVRIRISDGPKVTSSYSGGRSSSGGGSSSGSSSSTSGSSSSTSGSSNSSGNSGSSSSHGGGNSGSDSKSKPAPIANDAKKPNPIG